MAAVEVDKLPPEAAALAQPAHGAAPPGAALAPEAALHGAPVALRDATAAPVPAQAYVSSAARLGLPAPASLPPFTNVLLGADVTREHPAFIGGAAFPSLASFQSGFPSLASSMGGDAAGFQTAAEVALRMRGLVGAPSQLGQPRFVMAPAMMPFGYPYAASAPYLRTPLSAMSWVTCSGEGFDASCYGLNASSSEYWPVWPSPALTHDELAALAADPAALKMYADAMAAAGLPTAGFQPTADDYCAYLSQVGAPDGSSPVTTTPRLSAVEKRRGPRSATSKYRGVSCYKRTGRWESHIWSNGKQVHLGSFKLPEEAARAYDLAAIMFRGWDCETNFPPETYRDDEAMAWHMQHDSTEQYVQWLRKGGKEPNAPGSSQNGSATASALALAASNADESGAAAVLSNGHSAVRPSKAARTAIRGSPGDGVGLLSPYALSDPGDPSMSTFASGILPSVPIGQVQGNVSTPDLLRNATAPMFGDLLGAQVATPGEATPQALPLSALVASGVPTGDTTSGSDSASPAQPGPGLAKAGVATEQAEFFRFTRDMMLGAPE